MTVETNFSSISAVGNGLATVFPFTFDIFDNTNLVVVFTDTNGTITTLTEGAGASNYSVTVPTYPGPGSITYPATGTPAMISTQTITILRVLDLVQETDLNNQGGYFPEVQEVQFDKTVMMVQQLQEQLDRTVQVQIGDATDPQVLIDELVAAAAQAQAAADLVAGVGLVQATETQIGISEVATQAEVTTGTSDLQYITPLKLVTDLAARIASQAEAEAGTVNTAYDLMTPLRVSQAIAALGNSRKPIPRRQTVLSGPVTSNGLPNFGGSTGSGTVTVTGTLAATAANGNDVSGQLDRVGSKANPSWTGLTTNGTMYLYVDVNSNGTLTEGSTTVLPIYQFGGTPSTTSGQFTFNVQEMAGYVGNGATAPQTYRTFVGEVTVAGAVVTAIKWYAVMGRYFGAFISTLPTTAQAITFTHDLGCEFTLSMPTIVLRCLTAELNFAIGDYLYLLTQNTSGGEYGSIPVWRLRNTMGFTTGTTSAWRTNNRTSGAGGALTLANWAYSMLLDRGW